MIRPISTAARVYYVRGEGGQGHSYIAICRETGFLGVRGDFIDFTYVSHPDYRSEPFVAFLKKLCQSYLLQKAMGDGWTTVDLDEPTKMVRKEILKLRREREIDAAEASYAWYEIDGAEYADSVDDWHFRINQDDVLSAIRDDLELYPENRKPTVMANRFWNEVWVPFIEALPLDEEVGEIKPQ